MLFICRLFWPRSSLRLLHHRSLCPSSSALQHHLSVPVPCGLRYRYEPLGALYLALGQWAQVVKSISRPPSPLLTELKKVQSLPKNLQQGSALPLISRNKYKLVAGGQAGLKVPQLRAGALIHLTSAKSLALCQGLPQGPQSPSKQPQG